MRVEERFQGSAYPCSWEMLQVRTETQLVRKVLVAIREGQSELQLD